MKIGILGTGMVGETLASALVHKEQIVMLGSRKAGSEKGRAWVEKAGDLASEGSFEETAAFGDLLFVCINGAHALEAVQNLSPRSTAGKIVIDLSNPLDFSKGLPPGILPDYRERSLGEQIQEVLPAAFVVKTLNTVNANLMVDPGKVGGGDHHLFLCGNDTDAKNRVKEFLSEQFSWKPVNLLDLGPIQSARCTEAIVPFWVLLMQATGTPMFNYRIVQ